ncbi:bifunctional 3-oxoadipate enol-lactonase/4-carboxymuconolactone decarboxylase PcaDC [Salinisphaera aquimarina]|uniref:Alpha/beta fold hydrolase n=1 Tax=Salinisphaera aquimarina TaxID=2094031 RepID=A0ABV7EKU8_9GAMM
MPFLKLGDRSVAYRDTGPATAPAVLLAHPLGMSQAVWDDVVAALSPRLRLISWDLPGHGASAPAGGALSADDLAAEALALLDALAIDTAHFVGTSIGGTVGQALMVKAPERLERVVLTNTGAVIGNAEAWQQRAARVRSEGLAAMAPELVERWFGPLFKQAHPEAVIGWQIQLGRGDDDSYARLCELLGETDFTGRLGHFQHPVQLLAGAADAATPPAALEALARELPAGTVTVLDDVGHVPAVEAANALAEHLAAWLAPAGAEPPVAYEDGLTVRKSVLGAEHVERASTNASTLDAPFQSMITRMAWGEVWGNPDLSHVQRSLITVSILAALGRDGELVLHLNAARRIGVTEAQLRQALTHVAIYAGVPAANHAFKLAKDNGWGEVA